MISKLKDLHKNNRGFTIIEVMIVLMIAGLIMLIVFLAVPQLQRSQRNTRRKNDVNRIKTEVDNFASNNNSTIPVASLVGGVGNWGPAAGPGFFFRYLTGVTLNDPKTNAVYTYTVANNVAAVAPAFGTVEYITNDICSGESATTTGAQAANYVVITGLEGGAGYCVDNH